MKKKTKKRSRKRIRINKIKISPQTRRMIAFAAAVVLVFFAVRGIIIIRNAINVPTVSNDSISYQIRGVDVSSYQGTIDWNTLADQNIAFAYIKATEGSSHVDSKFTANWTNAQSTDLRIGAYHFMSFESSGEAQAANFTGTVTKVHNMLPPVIDVEYYGNYNAVTVNQASVDAILTPLIKAVKSKYGMDPVLYTTPSIYKRFIKNRYDNDIWIADSSFSQPLSGGREWTFCQYSYSGIMKGYSGGVKHIDLDVWNGSKLAFTLY
ncbi:MAG: glycoside hydrolase family 25 [Eubacteriaceae bacterium]|nr:glycoside hydrolase family 25 [Eubacteriaceae bacterium]